MARRSPPPKNLSQNSGRREPEAIRDAGQETAGFRAEGVPGAHVETRVPTGDERGTRRALAQQTRGSGIGSKVPAGRLGSRELNHRVDVRQLRFRTTDDLEPLEGVIEQERALEGLQTGLRIRRRNFNIYIAGASGTGKSSLLKSMIRRIAAAEPVPPDWCLVHNFKHGDNPTVFPLPPGRGIELKRTMERLVLDLKDDFPKTFHSKAHQERIQRILNEGLESENKGFLELAKQAQEIGFLVKSTKDGLVTIPLLAGKPVGSKDYAELNEEQRSLVEGNRQKLEPFVSQFLESTRDVEVSVHHRIQDAQRGLGKDVLDRHVGPVRAAFEGEAPVLAWLGALEEHVLDNIHRFLPDESDHQKAERAMRRAFVEYQVNVLVDNSEARGAPVLFENTPTYHNLVGKIDKRVENGIYSTDFTMVKAGALLHANGGFLVLHARDVLNYPFAWDALKGVLRYERLQIEEMGEAYQFLPTSGLRPDPIPVRCKLVLIGSNWLYHVLMHHDEDFGKTFQTKAEFDSEVRRTPSTMMDYARFVATTCRRDGLLPVDREGVASIIEFGARRAGSADRMTLRFNEICNLLIEADTLAREAGATTLTRRHVTEARRKRHRRISLLADKSIEDMTDGTLRIDTRGSEVGVINGLAVLTFADPEFGRPLRISAVTFQGKAGVINVEREARLSGAIHNKGVLILSGFLGNRFAQEKPLGLSVSLAVEQSYATIDGASASVAELCAVLSSLAEVPIRQDFAVTGSVSQRGEVQAIGGVNEKIEGFFRVCRERGLTGTQGVVIPATNVRHLILDPEVLAAIKAGRFHVHAVRTVEEALTLLTGVPAGERQADGSWTPDSIFARAAAKLARFAEKGNGDKKDHTTD